VMLLTPLPKAVTPLNLTSATGGRTRWTRRFGATPLFRHAVRLLRVVGCTCWRPEEPNTGIGVCEVVLEDAERRSSWSIRNPRIRRSAVPCHGTAEVVEVEDVRARPHSTTTLSATVRCAEVAETRTPMFELAPPSCRRLVLEGEVVRVALIA